MSKQRAWLTFALSCTEQGILLCTLAEVKCNVAQVESLAVTQLEAWQCGAIFTDHSEAPSYLLDQRAMLIS